MLTHRKVPTVKAKAKGKARILELRYPELREALCVNVLRSPDRSGPGERRLTHVFAAATMYSSYA